LRNILVKQVNRNEQNEIVSLWVLVSDLGLSRSGSDQSAYYGGGMKGLPFQWMAPESFLKGKFSANSDVYSFGVLSWELLTNGGIPWTIGATYEIVSAKVIGGERLVLPDDLRTDLRELILSCWHDAPAERPSFDQITQLLTDMKVYLCKKKKKT
jgi:serine/threonine protein kinase